MADMAPLLFGYVRGRYVLQIVDSDDPGDAPDVIGAYGYVLFTPSPSKLLVPNADPVPATVLPRPIRVELASDGSGYLQMWGKNNFGLQATDDPSINPRNWTWKADFFLQNALGVDIPHESFSFSLPYADHDTPLKALDLTEAEPVPGYPGDPIIVGPAGPPNKLAIGTVNTNATNGNATADIVGEYPNQKLNLGLPRGGQGVKGDQGDLSVAYRAGAVTGPQAIGPALARNFRWILAGNTSMQALGAANSTVGGMITMEVIQGGTGAFTFTHPSDVKWLDAVNPPVLPTGVGDGFLAQYFWDSIQWWGSLSGNIYA